MTSTPPPTGDSPPPYEPIAILRWLYRRFFSHIKVDSKWISAVQTAAEQGTVIYVMRSLSFLDFLCLDFLVKRFGLPLVRFVNDLGLWILEPFGRGERRLRLKRQIPEDVGLSRTVNEGYSALLFLRRPPRLGRVRPQRVESLEVDLVLTLVKLQRELQRDILLVPQTFVWARRPTRTRKTLADIIFGPSEWPGKLRVLVQFLFNYRNALLRAGEPFNLRTFVLRNAALSDVEVANKVRYAMLRRMERERTLVSGPIQKSPQRIRDELLRSRRVAKHIETTARSKGKSPEEVRKEAAHELIKLCAAPSPFVVGFLHHVLFHSLRKMYREVVVDQPGLDRIREAARQGTLVLIPSHKSHVDYLVLSEVMYSHDISPPLIAAGDNLNFWPLGPLLRRGGAFFIRRAFRGERLYSALVEAYIRKLIAEGFNIEFFFEGGRSRSGKLLPPKLGLLSMIIDAGLLVQNTPLFFVPIYIGYERIVEEHAYVQESEGGEKSRENLGGLLKAPRLLHSKYGRLYLRVGEVIALRDLVSEVQSTAKERTSDSSSDDNRSGGHPIKSRTETELTPPKKRALVQKTAYEVAFQINRVTVVTPSTIVATALLIHRKRGLSQKALLEISQFLVRELISLNAPIAHSLWDGDATFNDAAILEGVSLYAQGRLIDVHGASTNSVYIVPDDKRLALEYYKNNLLHFFVPKAIVATAVLATSDSRSSERTAVTERAERLSKFLKHEFIYPPTSSFEEVFDAQVRALVLSGQLIQTEGLLHPAAGYGGRELTMYAQMLRGYLEAYRLALLSLRVFAPEEIAVKEWLRKALTFGEQRYLVGDIEVREAIARPKLENALLAFRDLGLIRLSATDRISFCADTSAGLWNELEDELTTYLSF